MGLMWGFHRLGLDLTANPIKAPTFYSRLKLSGSKVGFYMNRALFPLGKEIRRKLLLLFICSLPPFDTHSPIMRENI